MKWILMCLVGIVAVLGYLKIQAPIPDEVAKKSDTPQTTEKAEDVRTEASGIELDLSGKQLTKAPMYIFNQTDLVHLNLSHNQLTGALQAEIGNLRNLKTLDLSDNEFTGVPAEVGRLSQLEILDLSNNQLTGLPHELGNLKNLKQLNLRGNNPSEYDLEIIRKSLSNTTILLDK